MIFIGGEPAIRLSHWAWLHVGPNRRLVGWDAEARDWVTTDAISAVASNQPPNAPRWAVTAGACQILLGEPGLPYGDGPLAAIDRLRADPTSGIDAATPIRIVPWRPAGDAVREERRSA